MNSWNNSTAPAYNLKVYNVINSDLQDKVFELMEAEDFSSEINFLIEEFDRSNDFEFQAGFNGRSGGYLVLYKGGRKKSDYKSYCLACGQKNCKKIEDGGDVCGRCGEKSRINVDLYDTYTMAGQSIEEGEVPADVLKRFRKLAVDIVKSTELLAREYKVKEETYTVEKTRKVLV